MRHSAIRISDSYAVPQEEREALEKAVQVYGAAKVAPDTMGGYFDFADWRGRAVGRDSFRGRWNLIYFGYARCKGSCREAAPVIATAAQALREKGLAARAAFIDIEIPPISLPRLGGSGSFAHAHAVNWPQRYAMAQLYQDHQGRLEVLTGDRAQLARATAAYHVTREHVPARQGERGGSINHSSAIYVIGPDTLVAAYGYHDMGAGDLVALVERLDGTERRRIDLAAIKQRYLRGACGGEV